MVKSVGKGGLELLGQTGVPPVTYLYLAGMALGQLGWQELILPRRARGAVRRAACKKYFHFDAESIRVQSAWLKMYEKAGLNFPYGGPMAMGWAGQT